MSFVLCSYYTLGTPYAGVAHDYLMASLTRFNGDINSDIRAVPSLGSWPKNTSYKAQFISDMMEQHSENIVFVDCDAEIMSYPELFNQIPKEYPFACHTLDRNKRYGVRFSDQTSKELLSGTLFIKNDKQSRMIVQEWNMACKMSPQVWEQQVLAMVLKKNDVPVYDLPIEYCWIKSLPDGREPIVTCTNPVIVHNQVSRKYRNRVNVCLPTK